MKLSLFWRLYLTLAASVIGVAALTLALAIGWLQHDGHADFLDDARTGLWLYGELHRTDDAPQTTLRRVAELQPPEQRRSVDYLPDAATVERRLQGFDRVHGEIENGEVWQDAEDQLFALFQLPDAAGYFLIGDALDHLQLQRSGDDNHDAPDEAEQIATFAIPGAVILLVLTLAGVLFLLVRRIESPLRELTVAAQRLADGEHHLRVPERHPEPIGTLATSFNRMGANIRQQIEEQRVLSHAIAHEFRSPLTRMQLALGLMEYNSDPAKNAALRADLERYIDDMSALTQRVLTLANIDHADDTTEHQCELQPLLLERVALLADPRLQPRLCEQLCAVRINPLHARLLIDNLLSNALRHTATRVEIQLQAPADGWVQLIVSDDGPGIPAAQRKTLLKPFARADSGRSRDTGGHGLGLAIVTGVVRRAGGSLVLLEADGGGLCVQVELPVSNTACQA